MSSKPRAPWSNQGRLVQELCERFGIPVPANGSAEEAQLLRDADAYVASLVMDRTRPPWHTQRPANAGATGAVSLNYTWQVQRQTLLRWDEHDLLNIGRDRIVYQLMHAAGGAGELAGCVGVPMYNCMAAHWVDTATSREVEAPADGSALGLLCVPCGKRASMTPYVTASGGAWMCGPCMREDRPLVTREPNRVVRLYPLVYTEKHHPMLLVPNGPPSELLLHDPPSAWDWPLPGRAATGICRCREVGMKRSTTRLMGSLVCCFPGPPVMQSGLQQPITSPLLPSRRYLGRLALPFEPAYGSWFGTCTEEEHVRVQDVAWGAADPCVDNRAGPEKKRSSSSCLLLLLLLSPLLLRAGPSAPPGSSSSSLLLLLLLLALPPPALPLLLMQRKRRSSSSSTRGRTRRGRGEGGGKGGAGG